MSRNWQVLQQRINLLQRQNAQLLDHLEDLPERFSAFEQAQQVLEQAHDISFWVLVKLQTLPPIEEWDERIERINGLREEYMAVQAICRFFSSLGESVGRGPTPET
jgi:Tfp pilus assembly protein PilN